jgi:hypothetical protein
MQFALLIALAWIITSTTAQAEISSGGSSAGSSSTMSRSGLPSATQRLPDSRSVPSAPGSFSYDRSPPIYDPLYGSALSEYPYGTRRSRSSTDPSPDITIPSLDDVMPGATSSGLLDNPSVGTSGSR